MAGKFDRSAWNKSKEKRSEGNSSESSKLNFARPTNGESFWKLLPPWSEEVGNPCSEVKLYFYPGENGKKVVYKGLDGFDCPLLQRYIAAKKEATALGEKVTVPGPKNTFQYNAVNVATGEVVVLQFGQMVQNEIDDDLDDRSDDFDPFDVDSKYVLRIKKTGKEWWNTKYKAKFVKVADTNVPEDIDLDNLPDLTQLHPNYTAEELQVVVEGGTIVKKEKDSNAGKLKEVKPVAVETEEEVVDVKKTTSSTKSSVVVDEDDLDDDEFKKTIAELDLEDDL